MRLVRLSVQRFQCIESADLDFAGGLNVLYGPNDLGKSSLAWAIRAVLLLQHSSSVHERFVSWYGGGEPKVALTLCDRDDRHWRVTKTFAAGGAGRSTLEASKDGRTFTTDCAGRQVDEKLRKMLGWGINAPGGQGPRGLPSSFLTQVLLAEQNDVRKVLFDASLRMDPEQSGRMRLTEALGALAQDPLFKKVLDETQSYVDQAFTPAGRKKRSAGSPFIDLVEQIKEMRREQDELEAKGRETATAEERIRGLNSQRDSLQQALEDAREKVVTADAQYAVWRRRAEIDLQLQIHRKVVHEVEDAQRRIEMAQVDLMRLQAASAASDAQLVQVGEELAQAEAVRDAARLRVDSVTNDPQAERRALEMEERQRDAQSQLHEAERSVERATDALRLARDAAQAVATALVSVRRGEETALASNDALTSATREVGRAEQSLADAEQRLREFASGDRAQARELRRKELENRRLKCSSRRAEAEQGRRQAEEVGQLIAKADAAAGSQRTLIAEIERAKELVGKDQAEIDAQDLARADDRAVELFGQLVGARNAVAIAANAATAAAKHWARAASLRQEEAVLRTNSVGNVPSATEVAALRALREELQIAEARLGGGISVTVRPKRPLALQATRDGVTDPAIASGEAIAFSANRAVELRIDDVVDLEITAGEASVREAAAEVRGRWEREGARLLQTFGVAAVEDIEALRDSADVAMRAADDRRRDAEHAEARAAEQAAAGDSNAAVARAADLEAQLVTADRARLSGLLAELGDNWQSILEKRAIESGRSRQEWVSQLSRHREDLARLETQLEGAALETQRLTNEVLTCQAELHDGWSALVARHQSDVVEVDKDLTDIDRQLTAMEGAETGEEALARQEVAVAESALTAAARRCDGLRAEAQAARDAVVEAATTLANARTRAHEVDVQQDWAAALLASSELTLTNWTAALARAEDQRTALTLNRGAVKQELEEFAKERNLAKASARDALEASEARFRSTRMRFDELQRDVRSHFEQVSQTQAALAEIRVRVAGSNVDVSRQALLSLSQEMAALGDAVSIVDPEGPGLYRATESRTAAQLLEVGEDLARARGALEQVGGAVVRERQRELDQAIQNALDREHELDVSFDAWKLLRDTLRETESAEGAHLGRALAGPVGTRFRQLTAGRYGALELGTHLEATGLEVAGDLRDIGLLSAGTQDQLATLLRLFIAEQLRSTIILDDQLTQSDPTRVAWFNTILRGAAQQNQIIWITCRPSEILSPAEFPAPGESALTGAGGIVRATDLLTVIRRFGSEPATPIGRL